MSYEALAQFWAPYFSLSGDFRLSAKVSWCSGRLPREILRLASGSYPLEGPSATRRRQYPHALSLAAIARLSGSRMWFQFERTQHRAVSMPAAATRPPPVLETQSDDVHAR